MLIFGKQSFLTARWAITKAMAKHQHMFCVRVPRAEFKTLGQLCAHLRTHHPRVNCFILLENLNLAPFSEAYIELHAVLSDESSLPQSSFLVASTALRNCLRPEPDVAPVKNTGLPEAGLLSSLFSIQIDNGVKFPVPGGLPLRRG